MPSNNTAGFATLAGSPIVCNLTALSTTPVQVLPVVDTGVSIPGHAVVRCRILNLSSSNTVAFTVGDNNEIKEITSGASPIASSGAITASASGALTSGDGVVIPAGLSVELNIAANRSLWLVANASGTPVQVAYFYQNG